MRKADTRGIGTPPGAPRKMSKAQIAAEIRTRAEAAKDKLRAYAAAKAAKEKEEEEEEEEEEVEFSSGDLRLPEREFGMVEIDSIIHAAPNVRAYKGTDITPEIDPGLPELAESIRKQGVIEPVVVQYMDPDKRLDDIPVENAYCLIAGFRRLAASKLAKRTTIPACVYKGELTPEQIVEIQITENIHRCDLRPLEEAKIYEVMADMGRTHEKVAARVGKSAKHVSRYLRLLTLPEDVRAAINGGDISLAKANVLLSLSKQNLDSVLEHYDYLLEGNYTAKEFETEVHRRFYRELNGKIGFDIDKTYKRTLAGVKEEYPPCAACPHRGQLELFEEYITDATCPNVGCFETKKQLALTSEILAKSKAAKEREKARARGEDVPETAEERKDRERREKYEAKQEAESAKWRAERKKEAEIEAKRGFERADPLINRKFKLGFSGRDYFTVHGEDELSMYEDVHTEMLNVLCKSYIGKDIDGLKSSGSIEEVFQAAVIKCIYVCEKNYDDEDGEDDAVKLLLGMEVEKDEEEEEEDEEDE